MSSFLDSLERELVAAVERHGSTAADPATRWQATRRRARRRLPMRLIAAVALITLAIAAAALAAAGVLFTGSAVPPIPESGPHVGLGIPSRGGARLTAHSFPDPAGGAPWGMRIVHTTRGLVCLQVGRLHDGKLGVIGEDGAFHDDGLFHPLPKEVIARMPQRFATACEPEGIAREGEVPAMPASAENGPGMASLPASKQRRLYFGLLGPDAVSLVYETGSGKRKIRLEPRTGAFLIVLPGNGKGRDESYAGGNGFPSHDEGRIRAEYPIVEISYDIHGRLCEEGHIKPIGPNPCPRESPEEASRRAREAESPPDLEVPIHVSLHVVPRRSLAPERARPGEALEAPPGKVDGVYYTAHVSFRAPFAVRGAQSGYSLVIGKPGERIGGTSLRIERDVRRGSIVHVIEKDVFANAHHKPVLIQIFYSDLSAKHHRGVIVGQTTVKEP